MKLSIATQEECAANVQQYIELRQKEIDRMTNGLAVIKEEQEFFLKQIAEAKQQGLEEFDSDIFMR